MVMSTKMEERKRNHLQWIRMKCVYYISKRSMYFGKSKKDISEKTINLSVLEDILMSYICLVREEKRNNEIKDKIWRKYFQKRREEIYGPRKNSDSYIKIRTKIEHQDNMNRSLFKREDMLGIILIKKDLKMYRNLSESLRERIGNELYIEMMEYTIC